MLWLIVNCNCLSEPERSCELKWNSGNFNPDFQFAHISLDICQNSTKLLSLCNFSLSLICKKSFNDMVCLTWQLSGRTLRLDGVFARYSTLFQRFSTDARNPGENKRSRSKRFSLPARRDSYAGVCVGRAHIRRHNSRQVTWETATRARFS